MATGQTNYAHPYQGKLNSRAQGLESKLGPAISLKKLEALLRDKKQEMSR